MTSPVEIYTDGSAIRNPGPAGTAYILRWYIPKENELPETKELEFIKGFRLSTNSRMEIMGALEGLTQFNTMYRQGTFGESGQVNLFSDSEYLCNAVNKRWLDAWQSRNWMTSGYGGKPAKPVANRDLWERLLAIMSQIRSLGINITFTHVMGHNGDPMNERADALARSAAENNSNQNIDTAYEQSKTQTQWK